MKKIRSIISAIFAATALAAAFYMGLGNKQPGQPSIELHEGLDTGQETPTLPAGKTASVVETEDASEELPTVMETDLPPEGETARKLSCLATKFEEMEALQSDAAYRALLFEYEGFFLNLDGDMETAFALLVKTLGSREAQDDDEMSYEVFTQDLYKRFGFAWACKDPANSLPLIEKTGPNQHLLTGWLASRMFHSEQFPEQAFSPRQKWTAIEMVADINPFSALNAARDHHAENMNEDLWYQLFFAHAKPDDLAAIDWMKAYAAELDGFPYGEIIREMRVRDGPSDPIYNPQDIKAVETLAAEEKYSDAISLIEELSPGYDGFVDGSLASDLLINLSSEDFPKASEWLVQHGDSFYNKTHFTKTLATMFRQEALENPDQARATGLALENDENRAIALSNVVIPLAEQQGENLDIEWAKKLDPGFPKARTLAGFVLGLSRHSNDSLLEAQVKSQFLKNEFELDVLMQQVLDSQLQPSQKRQALAALLAY